MAKDIYILGISAFYHDSAACLVKNGEIIAAVQEERFTRKKHDESFPVNAIEYCLKFAAIDINQVAYISFYDKPNLKFERLIKTYLQYAPDGFKSYIKALPLWLNDKLWTSKVIRNTLSFKNEIIYTEHHQSHAASAFYPSPYKNAAVLTLDGVGEWTTTAWGIGSENRLDLKQEIRFPHSIGLLYSAFTYYTGFKVNSGEYKVMGLAPYGEARYVKTIFDKIVDLKEDGSFWLDMDYFNYCQGLTMTSEKFHQLFGAPPRKSESEVSQFEMDLARSVQDVTEEIVLRIARNVRKVTGEKSLCMAGGVALNCVANGKLLREKIFDNLWIQPASGDAGNALGTALYTWHHTLNHPRSTGPKDSMKGSYLGPSFKDDEIEAFFQKNEIVFHKSSNICQDAARELSSEKVIGWFSGRMEFGPRALGGRSIIGDARSEKMQSVMNLKIKYRESFRPFAPSCLREDVSEYFELDTDSPYMLLVAPVQAKRRKKMTSEQEKLFGIDKLNVTRSDLPAITHVDYSARVQTVTEDTNPGYYNLIREYKKLTGYGVIINTSFNVRGEPIVCTPEDAYRCFMRTEMDVLVIENYILFKAEQKPVEDAVNWKEEFVLD